MKKTGILGGGQLGRMLLQQAANYPVETYVMENDPGCPAAHLCHHFVHGDIRNFDEVYQFGKGLDSLTIEIESVNVPALEKLESEGVCIYPRPAALKIITNKVRQKEFYAGNGIASPRFVTVNKKRDIFQHAHFLPAVQKLAEGGYDGRGVHVIKGPEDITNGFDEASVLEKMVDIHKEIAVIVGVSDKGETAVFPPVEMISDPVLNLLSYQVCPADLPETTLSQTRALALQVAACLQSPGLFAVEMFVDREERVYVNETAPRVHNSGHHTIEGNYSSQYDMLWRIILNYPLGNPGLIQCSALVNLIGENNYQGDVRYEGLSTVLGMKNTYVHLYGKKQTRPGRKMGHVTLTGSDTTELLRDAREVKSVLKAIS